MEKLEVVAMESFTAATELAGPVMDNINRAGLCKCLNPKPLCIWYPYRNCIHVYMTRPASSSGVYQS